MDEIVTSGGARLNAQKIKHAVSAQRTLTNVVAVIVFDDVISGVVGRHVTPVPTHGDGPLTTPAYFVVSNPVGAALADPHRRGPKVDIAATVDGVVADPRVARFLVLIQGPVRTPNPHSSSPQIKKPVAGYDVVAAAPLGQVNGPGPRMRKLVVLEANVATPPRQHPRRHFNLGLRGARAFVVGPSAHSGLLGDSSMEACG